MIFHNVHPRVRGGAILLVFLGLVVLLSGCGNGSDASSTSTTTRSQTVVATPTTATATPTPSPTALPSTPTPNATAASASSYSTFVGTWQVHDATLTIFKISGGTYTWNAGPCDTSMCHGYADILFTDNGNGTLTGQIHTVSYYTSSNSAPSSSFTPPADDPKSGYTFLLQHNGNHLLYITWQGSASGLNSGNRNWCDSYAANHGYTQCGA